jgi:BolA protein
MSIAETLRAKLETGFAPAYLELVNESHMHSVPLNSETHFRLVLVSEAFEGRRQVARHQAVYAAVADELAGPVHALALHTYTPDEWSAREEAAPASPACLGGSKAEQGGAGA